MCWQGENYESSSARVGNNVINKASIQLYSDSGTFKELNMFFNLIFTALATRLAYPQESDDGYTDYSLRKYLYMCFGLQINRNGKDFVEKDWKL